MNESFYDRQIEKAKEKQAISVLAMNVCASIIKFNKERTREQIKERIRNLQTSDKKKKASVKTKIQNELSKVKDNNYYGTREVEEEIKFQEGKYTLNLDYSTRHNLARTISDNPVNALKTYASDYVQAVNEVDRLEEQKRDEQKREQDRIREREQQRLERERKVESNQSSYSGLSTYGHSYSTSNAAPKKPVPFSAATTEESKKLVEEAIEKAIHDKYGYSSISYDEEKRIKELYPEFNRYRNYVSVDTLKKGIRIENIVNKQQINVQEMMELGQLTLNVVTKELVEGDQTYEPQLFSKLKMRNNLDKYKDAYNKFMKQYNKLSLEEKNKINAQVEKSENYSKLFGKRIITPEQLTNKINYAVIDYIVKEPNFYDYENNNIYAKTMQATKYMNVDQIVSLYKNLKNNFYRPYYGVSEEDQQRIENNRRKQLALLQQEFARVVLDKLQKHNKFKNTLNLSEEELHKLIEKDSEKMASIIVDLFKETPLSDNFKNIKNENRLEGQGTNLEETYKAKEEAKARVYGLSAVKKAFAQVSGKWARYTMLMDKEELTQKEQEELKGMFK